MPENNLIEPKPEVTWQDNAVFGVPVQRGWAPVETLIQQGEPIEPKRSIEVRGTVGSMRGTADWAHS